MKTRLAIAAATVGLAASMLSASPASAASGTQWDGTNPYDTYCPNNSYPIYAQKMFSPRGAYVGEYRVYYSNSCGTNWILWNAVGATEITDKTITRPAQGSLPLASYTERDYGPGWKAGKQVYAPGNTSIATSVFTVSPGWALTFNANF